MSNPAEITALLARIDAALAVPAQINAALASLNVPGAVQTALNGRQADIVTAVAATLNVAGAVSTRWDQERPAIVASASASSGSATTVLFVSATGSDAAAGTEAAPLATISAAIAKVPARGIGEIRLLSHIVVAAPAAGLTNLIIDRDRMITIMSATDTVIRDLSWAAAASTTGGNLAIRSFELRSGGLRFHRLRVVSPVAASARIGERMPVKIRSADPARGPIAVPTFVINQCTLSHANYWGGGHWLWTSPDDVTATANPFPVNFSSDGNTWQFTGRGGSNTSTIGMTWAGSLEHNFNNVPQSAVQTHTLPWLITPLDTW
jgi:hypothetical protein